MKTKIKALASIGLVTFFFSACNQTNEVNTPSEALTSRMQERFESDNYVTNQEAALNPFNSRGKSAGILFDKILKATSSNVRQVNSRDGGHNGIFRLASYHSSLVSNETPSWGIEDKSTLDVIADIASDHFDDSAVKDNLYQTNDVLKSYPASTMGSQKLLDDALRNNKITKLQYDLFVAYYKEILTAKTKLEASLITSTFETEVVNSKIDDNEKQLLLIVASGLKHVVFENKLVALNFGKNGEIYFQQTASAIATMVKVATIVKGFIVGTVIGAVGGLIACEDNYWNCVGKSALVGGVTGALAASNLVDNLAEKLFE